MHKAYSTRNSKKGRPIGIPEVDEGTFDEEEEKVSPVLKMFDIHSNE